MLMKIYVNVHASVNLDLNVNEEVTVRLHENVPGEGRVRNEC